VVLTSSIRTMILPAIASADPRKTKALLTLLCRLAAGKSACGGVRLERRSARSTGRPTWRARSSAWLNPRSRRRDP